MGERGRWGWGLVLAVGVVAVAAGPVATSRMQLGANPSQEGRLRHTLTRAEIEPMLGRVQNGGDVLRGISVPGFRVRDMDIEDPVTGVRMPGICVEVLPPPDDEACHEATVFANGVQIPEPDRFLRSLDPNVIDRVELFGPVDARAEFGAEVENGAVVIFTR